MTGSGLRSVAGRTLGLEQLLVLSTTGIYLLVILGAGTAVLDSVGQCTAWPVCEGPLVGADLAVLVAWAHRFVAGLVGVLVLVTAVRAWRQRTDPKIRMAVAAVTVLYPMQVVIGAITAGTARPSPWPMVHLTVGLLIFTSAIAALLWRLDGLQGPSSEPRTTQNVAVGSDDREPSTAAAGREFDAGFVGRVGAYVRLMKPKLMWLLCLVALAAMAMAAGPALETGTVVPTLAGGVLAIGASGTFNNVVERDVDRHMERTADRPVVEGHVPVRRAYAFGGLLTIASVAIFGLFVNALAATLGFLAILFYSVIYTMVLKPNTAQNTVLGGAVGAFPALIGWAAVTDTVGVPALALGAVIFLWTPAHFYNLALAYKRQYERAGFPMFPVVHGEARTRIHVLAYFAATMAGVLVLGAITRLDWLFAVIAAVLGGVFLWTTIDLFEDGGERAAFRTFHASNAYLGILLVAITVDSLVV